MARFEIPEGWTAQAYRFALDPTAAQLQALCSHAGARNFAFNTMLAAVKANLDQRTAEKTYGLAAEELTPCLGWSMRSLRDEWNQRKHVVAVGEDGMPWWEENSKEAYASGCQALANALQNWSTSRTARRKGPRVGFPRFKSKRHSVKKFTFTTGALRVEPDRRHVVLPRIGRVRTLESTRKLARRLETSTARILSATVSFTGGRWHCAFQVIVAGKTRPAHACRSRHPVVGVDVGVKDLLVIAAPDGTEVARIPAPKPLARAQSRLRAAQRQAARRCGPYDPKTQTRREPSKRWQRAIARVGRIHAWVAAIRAQEIHQATTDLAVAHQVVAVEELAVKNMARRSGRRKRGLNRALGDAALGRIATQLGYKTTWYGAQLVRAPRFFPSTQLCSRCAAKTKLRLRDRIYRCRNGCPPLCRDLNAAINLARLGDPTHGGGRRTGTGSRPAASVSAGDGRGAFHKTSPITTSGVVGDGRRRRSVNPAPRGDRCSARRSCLKCKPPKRLHFR
ncbi:IS607 family element RNA-guided endonuclease TnpB [Mycobacterium sp. 1164966.3]|uniref:IS607 family element RNA-guided endonuclease TnpB n=1 Tax=Mycobacterium sp. 1164966.3 TaxID=1856861 RepID=UPI000B09D9F9|nr:IS607 family element RNA-guided endonuclease TnpB [Mycobacterium sp. 1164966.3]